MYQWRTITETNEKLKLVIFPTNQAYDKVHVYSMVMKRFLFALFSIILSADLWIWYWKTVVKSVNRTDKIWCLVQLNTKKDLVELHNAVSYHGNNRNTTVLFLSWNQPVLNKDSLFIVSCWWKLFMPYWT